MKNNLFLVLCLTTACGMIFSSCDEKVSNEPSKVVLKAYCSSEGKSGVKTSIADATKGSVVWNDGDEIKVFNNLGIGSVMKLESGAGTPNGVFSGEVELGTDDCFYCCSPSSSALCISGGSIITVMLAGSQNYVHNSYDASSVPFASSCQLDGKKLTFSLKPVVGLARFGVRGSGSITKVILKDKSGKNLSGQFFVDASSSNPVAEQVSGAQSDRVILNFNTPALLSESEDTFLYFSLPVGSLSSGFDIEFTNSDDEVAVISTTSDNSISYGDMKCFDGIPLVFHDKCYGKSKISGTVSVKCGSTSQTYKTCVIGSQTWMAENYHCSSYSTNSDAYKEGRRTIPAFVRYDDEDDYYKPYYSNSNSSAGYYYNWAAVVGIKNGEDYEPEALYWNRQGICPDGWRVPSKDDWVAINVFLDGKDTWEQNSNAKYLKSETGWVPTVSDSDLEALDCFGFNARPFGCFEPDTDPGWSGVSGLNSYAYFACSTMTAGGDCRSVTLGKNYRYLSPYDLSDPRLGFSLRCVKN